METFLEYETMCRETPPGHVFVESLAEIDPRKVAEVVRRTRDKKTPLRPIFRALSETHSAISLETCKAWSLQASTPTAKFHPNPSKFPRFISENDVPDRYNIRRSPIISMFLTCMVMTSTIRSPAVTDSWNYGRAASLQSICSVSKKFQFWLHRWPWRTSTKYFKIIFGRRTLQ